MRKGCVFGGAVIFKSCFGSITVSKVRAKLVLGKILPHVASI